MFRFWGGAIKIFEGLNPPSPPRYPPLTVTLLKIFETFIKYKRSSKPLVIILIVITIDFRIY